MSIHKTEVEPVQGRSGIFGFQRLGDNRYTLSYKTISRALDAARIVHEKGMVRLPLDLGLAAGRPVVIDVAIAGYEFRLSMIYKVVCLVEGATYVEWWPRRRTDPDLLALWVDVLALIDHDGEAPPANILLLASEVFEFCRRSISDNPFHALGLETGACGQDVDRQYHHLKGAGEALVSQSQPVNDPRIGNRLQQALTALEQSHDALKTPDGRAWATRHFTEA